MRTGRNRRLLAMFALSVATVSASLVVATMASAVSQRADRSLESDPTSKSVLSANERLTSIAFPSPSRGYGVFNVLGNNTCSDRVGHTTNGGRSFSIPVTVVAWSCAKTAPASALAFDDHGDGFLYGPELFITHDNGASWSQSRQLGEVLGVEARGNSIWMLETAHFVPSRVSNSSTVALRLFSSVNGGSTWSALSMPRGAEVRPANAPGSGWLVRVNRTSAYLASSPLDRDGVTGHTTPLWFTSNSGATWSRRTIPCSDFNADMAISVAPDGALFDVCAGEPSAGNQLKETVRSTNEGRSWQIRSKCQFSTTNALRCTPGSQFSGYLGGIEATSRSTIYLVGGRSPLRVSRNGGRTWTEVPPGLGGDAGGTSQVIFFHSSTGIVLGDNDRDNELPTLWSTTDGGVHWTVREPQLGN